MKGVIVDRKGKYAVALTGDGSFIKIRNKVDYKVGYEVEFAKKSFMDTGLLRKISATAAVFLFTLGLSYGAYSYTLPYSYVDVDINPSIELTANVFDIIIKAETFNEDGKQLLKQNDIKFKTLDAGIAKLMDSAIEQGYLKENNDNTVLLTITSKNADKTEKLKESLESSTAKSLDKGNIKSSVLLQESTTQKRDEVKDTGISPGKMSLIEKAMKDEPGLKLEDLKDATVEDIMKHIPEYNKGNNKQAKQNKADDKKTSGNRRSAGSSNAGSGKGRDGQDKENDKDETGKGKINNGKAGNDKEFQSFSGIFNNGNTGNNENSKDKNGEKPSEKRGEWFKPGNMFKPFFSNPDSGKEEKNPGNRYDTRNNSEKDRQDKERGNNNNKGNNKNNNNNKEDRNRQKDKR